jgi:hypothetical protein
MKTNPLKEGALTENATGLGTVTRRMIRERALELAVINGRAARDVLKSAREHARRELTGDSDPGANEAGLDDAPESARWNPVSGSAGHKVPAAPSDDEDEEGRSDKERLVEEGIAEAKDDQMRQAAGAAARADRREA